MLAPLRWPVCWRCTHDDQRRVLDGAFVLRCARDVLPPFALLEYGVKVRDNLLRAFTVDDRHVLVVPG